MLPSLSAQAFSVAPDVCFWESKSINWTLPIDKLGDLPVRVIDRAFGISVLAFCAGAVIGAPVVFLPGLPEFVTVILRVRMTTPLQVVSEFGGIAVFLLVFLNNSIAVVLSFLYPFIMTKIHWTPPMTQQRMLLFMGFFTVLSSFLIGFFDLGAILGVVWLLSGAKGVSLLLSSAWVHGPLEFFLVLICVAEPLRVTQRSYDIVDQAKTLQSDFRILLACLLGLLVSAGIEVFLGL